MQVVRRSGKNIGIGTTNIADNRLRQAADRFDIFKAKIKQLRNALRAHHTDLVRAEASRSRVVQALKETSLESPLLDFLGGDYSYEAVHDECGRDMSARLKEYQVNVLTYVANWESTVTTRIATEIRHVDRLYKNFVRYHNKVESLQAAADKKKVVKDSDLEKISRNESKLRTARKEYHRNLVSVTLLTEEVTERGWKDLVPLVIRIMNFDMESSGVTAERMSRLADLRKEMEALAKRFEMDEETIRNGRVGILLENDAMDFVRPEDMQDIESIQASVSSYVPPSDRLRSNARVSICKPPSEQSLDDVYLDSPSGSEDDSACPEDEKKGTVAQIYPNVECSLDRVAPVKSSLLPVDPNKPGIFSKKPSAPLEDELEDQGSIINYPTSIYLKVDGTMHPMDDDETTLTPYPDMASC